MKHLFCLSSTFVWDFHWIVTGVDLTLPSTPGENGKTMTITVNFDQSVMKSGDQPKSVTWTHNGNLMATYDKSVFNRGHLISFEPLSQRPTSKPFYESSQGFHKLSAIQECQHCHMCFSCAIWNVLDHWSISPWNLILLFPVITKFTFINIIILE